MDRGRTTASKAHNGHGSQGSCTFIALSVSLHVLSPFRRPQMNQLDLALVLKPRPTMAILAQKLQTTYCRFNMLFRVITEGGRPNGRTVPMFLKVRGYLILYSHTTEVGPSWRVQNRWHYQYPCFGTTTVFTK